MARPSDDDHRDRTATDAVDGEPARRESEGGQNADDTDSTVSKGEPVAGDDETMSVPCLDPSCDGDATTRCYDSNVEQRVAFCDDHIDEWLAKSHITEIDDD
ncbi:hypothetical protein [Haloarcula nitratireducens]|uniref:Small CPxCG-related zinc finger protein n=1 Tax=Haloarcula nitratireducens TaxID=2487749 RepID=A0AAW4P930_9EURY|nr:hypothetical protein [Halomicroarcula nitratireducens]MBX0294273.1 hypothetical protein [Halomicroarcula nitratireducens]